MENSLKFAQSDNSAEATLQSTEVIDSTVQRLSESCHIVQGFDHVDPAPIPSMESVVRIIRQVRRIIFPGYFTQTVISPSRFKYCLGQEMTALFEGLSQQIILSVQHDCLRYDHPCDKCAALGQDRALQLIQTLPGLRALLVKDVRAALQGDPAAKSYDEVIFSYPGLLAITVYRMAHELYQLAVPLLPRMMTEYAHSHTGIDIHPGAKIGSSFFIDHGTGVVIGETTEIGNRVRLYQGVTLGAMALPGNKINAFRNKKRHPTIEDDVIIYSNSTILGGETVIGARSTIGGNIWITESVPPDTKVLLKKPELIYYGNSKKSLAKSRKVTFGKIN
jgi:serine O-acetyltransferase